MVPVIYSVTPSSGHSGGGQILQINGAGFRTQSPFANVLPGVTVSGRRIHGPWPTPQAPPDPTMQSNPVVPTTCAVYFSGYAFQQNPGGGPLLLVAADPVPAVNVGVVSSGILQCTTPVHDPSGIPYIDPTPNKAGQIAVPPSDVTVVNLDDNGDPIPGETFTLSQSYSFLRPNLTVPGVAATLISALILDLQRQIMPNVEFNPHTDYDPTSGDFLNITIPAALPALALINLKMPQAEGRPRTAEEEVTYQTSTGYVVSRLSVLRDLEFTMLGVSDSQVELLGLAEALEVYFRRTLGVNVLANSDNPSLGTVNFPIYRETDTVFTGRIGTSNIVAFTFSMRIVGVPFSDFPGIAPDAFDVGATFAGNLGLVPGTGGASGAVMQSVK